jgi:putative hemolysin
MMVTSRRVLASAAAAGLVAACGGDPAPSRSAGSEDERGAIGVPPPPDEYCKNLGFVIVESACTFPDGTSCDQWAFYRGECGQERSYCNQQGGQISTKTEDMGTWTAVTGVCTLNGKECDEARFMQTGVCE